MFSTGWHEEIQELQSFHSTDIEKEFKRLFSFLEIDPLEEELILEFKQFEDENRIYYLNKDVYAWCRQNKMRPRICTDNDRKLWLKFSKKSQLVLFKLRWL